MRHRDDGTPDVPVEDLQRTTSFEITRADEDTDGLTLEGYAAMFNSPTLIDSMFEGRFNEQIKRGAFSKSIRENTPVLQFDHGMHPLIGSIPIGAIRSLKEDERGLFVRARLSNNWLIEPVRQAIADGAVNGMSFRFSVVREQWQDKTSETPTRTLTEVKVHELGPVVWPAYSDTSVGVRSREVLLALSDPDVRSEVARVLVSDQTAGESSGEITPVEDSDAPPVGHPSRSDEGQEGIDAPSPGGHPSPHKKQSSMSDREIKSNLRWINTLVSLTERKGLE